MSHRRPSPRQAEKDAYEDVEKALVRAYFQDRPSGIAVDVGANEPISAYSQSWHLERELSWSCVLVEPYPELAEKARRRRPSSQVFECACVGPDEAASATLFVPVRDGAEHIAHAAIGKNLDDHDYVEHREIKVAARTLDSILEEAGVDHVDLLSIDVEGAEMAVLRGIDLERWRPALVLLEDKHVYLEKHRYLRRRGYRLVKRTGGNCWYVPRAAKRPEQPVTDKLNLMRRLYLSIWIKKLRLALRERTLAPFRTL